MTPRKARKDCLKTLGELECYETFQHAEILRDVFVGTHTEFATVEAFFFKLPKAERCTFEILDKYVKRHTEFETWIEMLCRAKEG